MPLWNKTCFLPFAENRLIKIFLSDINDDFMPLWNNILNTFLQRIEEMKVVPKRYRRRKFDLEKVNMDKMNYHELTAGKADRDPTWFKVYVHI